jgi:hypothetical protein
MILAFITLLIGFGCGFAVGLKNAKSTKVEKALDLISELKGKKK